LVAHSRHLICFRVRLAVGDSPGLSPGTTDRRMKKKQTKNRPTINTGLRIAIAVIFAFRLVAADTEPASLRIATFDLDVTPPVGSWMAYDPVTNTWDMGLRARGIIFIGSDQPVVLCAIDWIGIANESHDAFREALARAVNTTPSRVSVHTLHQHDAPDCDFGAERILRHAGQPARNFESTFARQALQRLEAAAHDSLAHAQPVTELGLGQAQVYEVASNRRVMGADGKVRAVRYTSCADPLIRAEPEGTIDPQVSLVSLWSTNGPVAVLSYYATHPQSYYRTGVPNPDFPGIARFERQLEVPDALHIHFNGAGGNIGAGKYNDGSHTNRTILAERLADGMRRAWQNTKLQPVTTDSLKWSVTSVSLPPSTNLVEEKILAQLANKTNSMPTLAAAAAELAWLERCQSGHQLEIGCLSLGPARILHMPGELFVEYQLAAKAERPDLFVAMAAYGDYGTAYIGTAIAYTEGGYETGPHSSFVAPESEAILMKAIRTLLHE
jgi:hypothetical protein